MARLLALDPINLAVGRINGFARTGVDEDFDRGTTVYQQNLGDPAIGPNPTLVVIGTAPFFAIKLYPGEIGSGTGLVTDQDTRVLGADSPIPGLFAAGNDMQSVMRGVYPGPGITLGPAITFAYGAAKAAARKISALGANA